jgi:hypothetical protein
VVRVVRGVTLAAFLLNLQGPAWAALLPAFAGAGPRVRLLPSADALRPRANQITSPPNFSTFQQLTPFGHLAVRGRSIIGIRETLLGNGFVQSINEPGHDDKGFLFTHPSYPQAWVRIMRRNGAWDIRIRNEHGAQLDECGHVAKDMGFAHGIEVESK